MKYLSLLILAAVMTSCSNNIAFIDTSKVMKDYKGMVEAREAYQLKVDAWGAQIDSAQRKFQHELAAYQANAPKMSASKKEVAETRLQQMQQESLAMQKQIQAIAQEEETAVTQEVIEIMNGEIEEFAKEKGYDFILGANGTGSLIYATDSKEITEEVLEYLNR